MYNIIYIVYQLSVCCTYINNVCVFVACGIVIDLCVCVCVLEVAKRELSIKWFVTFLISGLYCWWVCVCVCVPSMV